MGSDWSFITKLAYIWVSFASADWDHNSCDTIGQVNTLQLFASVYIITCIRSLHEQMQITFYYSSLYVYLRSKTGD